MTVGNISWNCGSVLSSVVEDGFVGQIRDKPYIPSKRTAGFHEVHSSNRYNGAIITMHCTVSVFEKVFNTRVELNGRV